MAEERVQRRLAAILAADVVGYCRLMDADERGMLARLHRHAGPRDHGDRGMRGGASHERLARPIKGLANWA